MYFDFVDIENYIEDDVRCIYFILLFSYNYRFMENFKIFYNN